MNNPMWYYEINDEISSIYKDKEKCIEEGRKIAISKGLKIFTIKSLCLIDASINTYKVLENIREDLYDDVGEFAEDCFNTSEKEFNELDKELNKVFDNWKKKYGYEINNYVIDSIETIKIN